MVDAADKEKVDSNVPVVSIGLPVFNGENYLRQSIQSILDQTFQDFELIISDNCSTDGTEDICREFAGKSDKIRYYRQSENVGASANFDFTYLQARGKYFKWQGHDDYAYPEFLEKCLERLREDPDAVLCQSHVAVVDSHDDLIEVEAHETRGTNSDDPIKRFAGRLSNPRCTEIFAVFPTAILKDTERLGAFASSDRCLLSQLALKGRFLDVPEVLFAFRIHPEQFSTNVMRHGNFMYWFDPNRADWPTMRHWTHFLRCIRYLNTEDLSAWNRVRGFAALFRAQIKLKSLRAYFRESGRMAKYGARRLLAKLT